jgi:tetratricopeptide (TPR) repeat protein
MELYPVGNESRNDNRLIDQRKCHLSTERSALMNLKVKSIVLLGSLSVASFFGAAAVAENSDNIKKILMDTKLSELDMKVDERTSQQARDTKSLQYKIGFKDGYEKAVQDLKSSVSDGSLIIPGATVMVKAPAAENPQQAEAKAKELTNKSFSELVNDGDWDAAIASATEAIRLKPTNPIPYINRSWARAEKGQLDEAINDANKAVELSPRNPMAHNNRAYAYELAGSLTKAKQDYQIACELNYQPACDTVAQFERARTGDTQREVKELLNRSFAKFRDRDWKAVEQFTSRAIELDPANAMAYVNRAGARAELGLLPTALQDCNRAIQLNPGLGLAHNNCGYTYELMGQPKQAQLAYQQACDLGVKKSCKDYYRLANQAQAN